MAALTLFFCLSGAFPVFASPEDFDTTLTGYVARMVIALSLLGLAGYAVAKYMPGRFARRSGGRLRLIASLSLGRDFVYIVQTGPDVVALFVGKTGSTVLKRWGIEEWEDFEATLSDHSLSDSIIKGGR